MQQISTVSNKHENIQNADPAHKKRLTFNHMTACR